MLRELRKDIKKLSNPARAKFVAGYFKTGPGEYGEGDTFLGLSVPQIHKLAKEYRELSLSDVVKLLHSKIHEERLIALDIMVIQFQKGDEDSKHRLYNIYLDNTKYINNWDLIDLTSDRIIGAYLENKPKEVLYRLAKSESLWERRIAMLATFHFISKKQSEETLKIAELLLHDPHDLIHKAVGWALREVGKRCGQEIEEEFLNKYASSMPRTMLRYAVERFPEDKKRQYMAKKT